MITQSNDGAYSPLFSIRRTLPQSAAALSAGSATADVNTSSTSARSTATMPSSVLPSVAAASTSSPVEIIIPTPTSSWDASREEDHSLTINDKVAIGIGIPTALLCPWNSRILACGQILLASQDHWRTEVANLWGRKGWGTQIVVGSGLKRDPERNNTWSRAPSLWGSGNAQSFGETDTELLNKPSPTMAPYLRPDSAASVRSPSALRQAWTPV
jgi:hypothetical protein